MSRKKSVARRHGRRKNTMRRVARLLVSNVVYLIFGGAILLFVGALIASTQHIPIGGAANQNAAQTSDGWIRLTSKSPSAIIAAARKSSLFNVDRSGNGDYLKDLSHLENPVLVRAYHPAGSPSMPDYYVIPIDNAAGAIVGAAELELNKPHNAIRVTAIVTYPSLRPHGYMARVSMATAIADVTQQRHIRMKAGAINMLIYFPVDAYLQKTGKIVWNGGGEYPSDPIWLIPGTDGQDYIVGTDGVARHASDLPILKQP